MNAFANIQVRVYTAAARAQIKALQGELAALQKQTAVTGASMNTMGRYGLPMLSKWGNQIQWAGRQLQYNFTLPILLASGAATKFALDNEKAMTRVTKVYGDNTPVFNRLAKTEIPALGKAFEALSNQFGVARKDVINIAGDWAAAGASGVALAKSVQLTLQTMILGEMDAATTTQALIAIQAQYGLSTKQLSKTIDILNMTENQTGISMEGLVQGMARAAGQARDAGIDVQHLAAFLSALTPAAGTATQAGNAFKTMVSRLLAPTKDARAVLKLMHIEVDKMAWKSLNGSQRLELMAKQFKGLSAGVKSNVKVLDANGKATGRYLSAQQAVVSSVIASRFQVSRFDVLMRDITNKNGYYQKSLNATADSTRNFTQKTKELNIVLNSNPQRLKQMWVILQNALADTIQPMLPYIVWLAKEVANLGRWFSNLNPFIQKATISLLLLLAVIGPLTRYIGSFMVLGGLMSKTLHMMAAGFVFAGKTAVQFFIKPMQFVIVALMDTIGAAAGFAIKFPALIFSGMKQAGNAFLILRTLPVYLAGILVEMTVMFRTWMAALPGIFASIRIATGTFILGLGAMQAGASVALARIMGIFIVFGARLPMIMGTAQAVMASAWTAFTEFLIGAATLLRSGLGAVWATMYIRLSAISAAGSGFISGIWTKMTTFLYAATIGIQVRLVRLWELMMAKIAAFTLAGSMATLRSWMVGLAGMVTSTRATLTKLPALFLRFGKFLISWPAIIVMALLGIVYAFRNQIAQAWKNIVASFQSGTGVLGRIVAGVAGIFRAAGNAILNAFWALPAGVRNAMLAVVGIVRAAAMAVYKLFSYLNPWAHHSPSLVESVTSGMDEIMNQYARASGIGDLFKKVASDLARFKAIASTMGKAPWQDERKDVAKNYSKALPVFDSLVKDWKQLNNLLDSQDQKVKRQQAVVDKWKASLDAANATLDKQQKALDLLQNQLSAVNDEYQAHQDALNNFAQAPLAGMKAVNEAMFQNEMAQKSLQLQMMDWTDVNGSLDDLRKNYEALSGDIEVLRGESASLRSAGAGTDITAPLEQQMAAMKAQADALSQTIDNSPIGQLQAQLDALQRQAERMDLEKALQFEPLQHQIENLIDTTKELTFDEIVAGIKNEQASMAGLQPQIDSLTAAIANQTAIVDAATAARDQIQASYDAEDAQLQNLQDQYQKTSDAIRDVEQALRDMASAATDANTAAAKAKGKGGAAGGGLTPGAQNFLGAAGGGFPDPGFSKKIGRQGTMADQSKMIDEFTKQINDQVAGMFGKIDMAAPLKKKWHEAVGWLKENVAPDMAVIGGAISDGFSHIGNPFSGNSGFAKGFQDMFDSVSQGVSDFMSGIKKGLDLFAPDIKRIFDSVVSAGQDVWNKLGPELKKFGPIWNDLGKALGNIWTILKPFVAFLAVGLAGALKIVASIFSSVVGPALSTFIAVLTDVVRIFRGVIEVIVGLLSGDWAMAWQGAKDIVVGMLKLIGDTFAGAINILIGLVSGLVHGIVEFFQWLFDILVGHSIIPDLVDAIIKVFQLLADTVKVIFDTIVFVIRTAFDVIVTVWSAVLKPVFDAIVWVLKNVLGPAFSWLWDSIISPVFGWIGSKISGVWTSIIQPALSGWHDIIKNVVGPAISWLWDSVISPVFGWIGGKIGDVWLNVIKPTFEKIRDFIHDDLAPAFDHLKDAISGAFDKVANAARVPFNFVIDDVYNNGLKAMFDKVASAVGLKWTLPHADSIPKFARGGAVNGPGNGTSDSITAKLSRGEHVWTAKEVANAGGHNAVAQIRAFFNGKTVAQMKRDAALGGEMFGLGGAWDWVTDKAGDAKDWAVTKTLDWVSAKADGVINSIMNALPPSSITDIAKHGALSVTDKVLKFAAGLTNTDWNSPLLDGKAGIQAAQKFAKSQVGKPYLWGGVGPDGYDCSGFMSALTNVIRGQNPYSRIGSTANFPWSGFASGKVGDFTIGSTNRYPGSTVGHMAGTLGSMNVESRGGTGVIVGPGARGFADSGFSTFASISAAANGALVKASKYGSLLRVGEGGRDEAVVPLPKNLRDLPGNFGKSGPATTTNTYHFHGDLSFPNVTDGNDADAFLKNLEILAKD